MSRFSKRSIMLVLGLPLLALGFLFSGVQPASAAQPADRALPGHAVGSVRGTILDLTDDGFVVSGRQGREVDVIVTADTTLIIPGVAQPTLADFAVGDHVGVRGTPLSGDRLEALRIAGEPDGDRRGGRMVAADANGLTVANRDGETIVVATAETLVYARGVAGLGWAAGGADLAADATGALVYGVLRDDGSLEAAVILLRQRITRVRGAVGTVVGVNADDFELELPGGTVLTVGTTAETRFRLHGLPDAALADLEAGMNVAVRAELSGDGPIARWVVERPVR